MANVIVAGLAGAAAGAIVAVLTRSKKSPPEQVPSALSIPTPPRVPGSPPPKTPPTTPTKAAMAPLLESYANVRAWVADKWIWSEEPAGYSRPTWVPDWISDPAGGARCTNPPFCAWHLWALHVDDFSGGSEWIDHGWWFSWFTESESEIPVSSPPPMAPAEGQPFGEGEPFQQAAAGKLVGRWERIWRWNGSEWELHVDKPCVVTQTATKWKLKCAGSAYGVPYPPYYLVQSLDLIEDAQGNRAWGGYDEFHNGNWQWG